MSALKKKIISHNISFFLDNNLLVLFFNYNHMSTEEWGVIKNQFSKIDKVNTLVVKNKIGYKVIEKNINVNTTDTTDITDITVGDVTGDVTGGVKSNGKAQQSQCDEPNMGVRKEKIFENISTLFQGPTFLIGLYSPEQSKKVLHITKKEKKLIFVGGLYQEKQINHLDLDYLLKVEKGAHGHLLSTLQSLLYVNPLKTHLFNLCYSLKCYADKKSIDTSNLDTLKRC